MATENTNTPTCDPTAIYLTNPDHSHLRMVRHAHRHMSELRGLHGTAQQRRLRQSVQRARPQIHHGEGVSSVHDRHAVRRKRGNQRCRHLQNRASRDGDGAQRRGGERLGDAERRELGERNALSRNADVERNELETVGEEEAAEIGGEDGAADGVLAEPAVGEGEGGSERNELVGGVESERPADSQVLRVESDELDLARCALVVLGVRRREEERRGSRRRGLCRGGGIGR